MLEECNKRIKEKGSPELYYSQDPSKASIHHEVSNRVSQYSDFVMKCCAINKDMKSKININNDILKKLTLTRPELDSLVQQTGGLNGVFYAQIIEGINIAFSLQTTLNTGNDLHKMKRKIKD
mmetsp:Transcript_19025/g.21342  ORF Transcript_19025/g.21342 Transcript_19025/m.21342 type:complete len:122 (-) Transcript_19025:125-490(-)